MKVIVAGPHNPKPGITAETVALAIKESGYNITEIVSGGARFVDEWGEEYAHEHGIPVKVFRADWAKHGRSAGPMRNREMAAYADALILVWDGSTPGSLSMRQEARNAGIPIHEKLTTGITC